MPTLIIDNYDSFTFNLAQAIGQLGGKPIVFRNDAISIAEARDLAPRHIIISPGPGSPSEGGISAKIIDFYSRSVPTLGVCLGHQIIADQAGAVVERADTLVHGKDSPVFHAGGVLWKDVPSPFPAGRYHSLTVRRSSLPPDLLLSAWTETGVVMGIQHRKRPLFGVQFHPESILTPDGLAILKNFLSLGELACDSRTD